MRSVFLAFLLAVFHQTGFGDAQKYQIVTEEWAPYNYVDNGVLTGISADIVEAIMKVTHDTFPIQVLPSMRSIYVLSTAPRTIMFSLFRTAERESKYKWVGPIVEESIYPYKLKKSTAGAKTLAELKLITKISTRIAGLVPSRLLSLGFENLESSAAESEQLYKMLFAGRTEVIVGDTDLGVRYYLKKLNLDYGALEKLPVEVVHSSLYIAFSPDTDDQLVASWGNALKSLKEAGVLKKIVAKYQ